MTIYNKPIILADNFFDDVVVHPGHVVSQTLTEVAGSEVFNIADNLRDLTQFTTVETNTALKVRVDCGSAKAADCIILDRGHNLAGQTVKLHTYTAGDFSTGHVQEFSAVVPASPGGLPTDANGCLTSEGVWWKMVGTDTKRYWEVEVSAMGASLSPIITGLYLGATYRLSEYLDSPGAYDYRIRHQVLKNVLSERGVRVKRRILNFREVDLKMTLEDPDFAAFNTQARQLMIYNHPWWFCLDDSAFVVGSGPDLLGLFQLAGDTTFDPVVDPVHRVIALPLEEVIPVNTM